MCFLLDKVSRKVHDGLQSNLHIHNSTIVSISLLLLLPYFKEWFSSVVSNVPITHLYLLQHRLQISRSVSLSITVIICLKRNFNTFVNLPKCLSLVMRGSLCPSHDSVCTCLLLALSSRQEEKNPIYAKASSH